MKLNIGKEVAALEQMTVGQLQQRHVEVFGEQVRSRHKQYLIRRIAWRLQANAEGGLSERALRRAEELANLADVRVTPPRAASQATHAATPPTSATDHRPPPPGTAVTLPCKGRTIAVTVLRNGFDFEGERHKSLTGVATVITGQHINGFRFFGVEGQACPTDSLPALEIENAVVDQIRCIGRDPGLLGDTLDAARRQTDEAIERLTAERRAVERGLARLQTDIRRASANGPTGRDASGGPE